MKKLDKKQLPQFMGLCVLSTGTFGYFGVRMVTPSPAAAATRPVLKPSEPAAAPAGKAAAAPAGTVADAAADAAPPPAPGMRDPFVVGYTDPKTTSAGLAAPLAFTAPLHGSAPAASTQMADTKMADAQISNPQIHEQVSGLPPAPVSGLTVPGFLAAPPLPSAAPALPPQKIMPLPAPPPAPPKWSVTGLLQGEDGAGVAILRDGESRRIVHVGDFVDDVFRVTRVTRSAVVLRHGKTFYTLPLGTKSEKSEAPTALALPAPAAPPAPAVPVPPLPRQSQAAPVPARPQTTETVASALPLRLLDGTEMGADAAPAQRVASLIR